MISEFVDAWDNWKAVVEKKIREKEPDSYEELVTWVVEMLNEHSKPVHWSLPDPKRIHEINDGDYQGTLVYVIGADGYQPDTYWYVKVAYGSCSGCDTLEHISSLKWGYSNTKDKTDEEIKDEQVKQYMMLALNIIQGMKQMGEETV